MTEAEQSYTNGTINEEDEDNKVRPADIEAVSVCHICLQKKIMK